MESSVIPGETEEDGLLRREYVLVGDTRALEFNRAVDGEGYSFDLYNCTITELIHPQNLIRYPDDRYKSSVYHRHHL